MSVSAPYPCQHDQFAFHCSAVRRVADDDPSDVVGFMVEIRAKCQQCGVLFQWVAPTGMSDAQPMTDVSKFVLRAPMQPAYTEPRPL